MANDWSAAQYLKFNTERTRPARDLLARVPLASPELIVDLGCGPGNSTAVIAERYPNASLSGIDSSPDMIRKAKETLPNVHFEVSDLEAYRIDGKADLLFSNAVFQWLPGARRLEIIRTLMQQLAPGGALAFQAPDNLMEPSHVAMRDAAFEKGKPWTETLARAAPARDAFPTEPELYDALQPISSDVDIWRTTYYHIMDNHEAIVEWVKSTGLRPFLDPLDEEQKRAYLENYLSRLRELYEVQNDGKILLAYPRLFVVAVKN